MKKYFNIYIWIYPCAFFLFDCASQKKAMQQLENYNWFSFNWYSAAISGKKFDHLAILVPAKVNDLKANFILQFDLGSDATLLYGNVLNSYYSENEINSFLLKDRKGISDAGHISYDTDGLRIEMGDFIIKNPSFKENYGLSVARDSLYSSQAKNIGTLGADAFQNKILIIDYPNKKMCVLNELDDYLKKNTTFIQARSKNGRLHIPFTIKNKTYWFLFDTGASLFPINTNKGLWKELVERQIPLDTIEGNSWGEKVKFYGGPMKKTVYLNKYKLKNSFAWYNENKRLQDFNKSENIDGLTGNIYFIKNIIVLDFKSYKFGILK